LITSSLNVFYRDINFVTQAAVLIWFYATPIIYPLKAIPPKIRPIFYLNPLSGLFSLLHNPLVQTSFPLGILLFQIGMILIITLLGIWVFRKKSPHFSDWL